MTSNVSVKRGRSLENLWENRQRKVSPSCTSTALSSRSLQRPRPAPTYAFPAEGTFTSPRALARPGTRAFLIAYTPGRCVPRRPVSRRSRPARPPADGPWVRARWAGSRGSWRSERSRVGPRRCTVEEASRRTLKLRLWPSGWHALYLKRARPLRYPWWWAAWLAWEGYTLRWCARASWVFWFKARGLTLLSSLYSSFVRRNDLTHQRSNVSWKVKLKFQALTERQLSSL